MGIEIIRLGEKHEMAPGYQPGSGSELHFQSYHVQQPEMNIWMMFADNSRPMFSWWAYARDVDDDIAILNNVWSVTSQQGLFDCLFLAALRKVTGNNFYAVFPGTIKTQNWANVQPSDRTVYLSGQACIYHLHGDFDSKLSIQWVPFWQPQSLVKDPAFFPLWRLFQHISAEDAVRCVTFFQLSDPTQLPAVINLLNDPEEKRSEKLSSLVDWFGMYSAPVQDNCKPGFVLYTKEKDVMDKFADVRKQFEVLFCEAQKVLAQNASPKTVLRFLSGHIAL